MTPHTDIPSYIDSTMRSCFVSCPQKFRKEFLLGLRPATTSIDLHAGSCFATAIETVYRGVWELGLSQKDAMIRANAAFWLSWGDFEIPPFKRTSKTPDNMWYAVESYFKQYDPKLDRVQPYFGTDGKATFEYTFAIPLEPCLTFDPIRTNMEDRDELMQTHFPSHPSGEPFLYCGRFDMLGRIGDRPVVRDEKTTGHGFSANWAESWDLRAQFLGYIWACRTAGIDLDTVVVRGVSIQKKLINLLEAEKQYPLELVARWHEQLRRDMWRYRRAIDEGYFDYNFGEACTQYGNCSFINVCGAPPDQEESWHANYAVRRWNPLQKNPIAGEKSDVA